MRRQLGECRIGARAAGGGIGNDADPMSARRLAAGKIDHVAKQSPDRGAQNVENS